MASTHLHVFLLPVDALIIDHSAVAAIQGITHRFEKADKKVMLVNLTQKSHKRLHRTGDHEVLKRQITNADEIKGYVEEGDNVDDQQNGHDEDTHLINGRADESNFGAKLNQYPMFAPHGDVNEELDRMAQAQGRVSMHSVKDE